MEKLIIALDVANADSAKKIIDELGDEVVFYKLGLELMMSGQYFEIIKYLKKNNKKVFADLKLYDITQTMVRSVENLKQYQIDMLTIHCANDEIMRSVGRIKGDIKVVGVSVLTNLDRYDLVAMGFDQRMTLEDLVEHKTKMALEAGLDGVVASAQEAIKLRKSFGDDFLIVTPGIRLNGVIGDDQKRSTNVAQAIANGASYLVVGRPILQSDNIKLSAQQFIKAINEASANS
ncbi:MAG: orotidine-5-phosphate decarboxylase [Pseudomonadota bacterium]|jgi:orotidine-5'-phosphate decarboxylase